MRPSPFLLAVDLDIARDAVTLRDWTNRRSEPLLLTVEDMEVLNLFSGGLSVERAAGVAGAPVARIADAVGRLHRSGALLDDEPFLALRRARPYQNLPSLAIPARPETQFASYEQAYRNAFVPWNELPPASDLVALTPLPFRRRGRLLDVGCGSGKNLPLFDALGFDVSGLDVSATAIDEARRVARTPERLVVGSAAALPWPDASFDVVADVGCLHCLPEGDRPEYVREVARVLAPGGRFLCRSFKPRDTELVQAQPVAMERLGFDPEEVVAIFAPHLAVRLVREGPVHVYFEGTSAKP